MIYVVIGNSRVEMWIYRGLLDEAKAIHEHFITVINRAGNPWFGITVEGNRPTAFSLIMTTSFGRHIKVEYVG